jgi:hypothetical protein
MSNAQLLDDFMDRLKAENLVIVHRSMVRDVRRDDLSAYRRKVLRNRSLTCKQIADGELWGKIDVARVRQLVRQHCGPQEMFEAPYGEKSTITKVIRAGVERVARIRSIPWD